MVALLCSNFFVRVAVFAVMHMVLGAAWYHVCGEIWKREVGECNMNMNLQHMVMWFANAALFAWGVFSLFDCCGDILMEDLYRNLLILWGGFMVPVMLSGVVWGKKSFIAFAVEASVWLISLYLMVRFGVC